MLPIPFTFTSGIVYGPEQTFTASTGTFTRNQINTNNASYVSTFVDLVTPSSYNLTETYYVSSIHLGSGGSNAVNLRYGGYIEVYLKTTNQTGISSVIAGVEDVPSVMTKVATINSSWPGLSASGGNDGNESGVYWPGNATQIRKINFDNIFEWNSSLNLMIAFKAYAPYAAVKNAFTDTWEDNYPTRPSSGIGGLYTGSAGDQHWFRSGPVGASSESGSGPCHILYMRKALS